MKHKPYTYATITNGKITYMLNKDKFNEALLKFEGQRVKLTVEKIYENYTSNQREYYFAVVIPCCQQGIQEQWGENYTPEQAHIMLKENLLFTEKVNNTTGEVIRLPRSITELDIIEMIEFIEHCIKFIAEWFCIAVPEADKNWRNK